MAQQTKRKAKTGSANGRTAAGSRSRTKGKSGSVGDTLGSAAKQLKTPLIAAGTGLAGIAAGAVLARERNKGRSTTKRLGEAAKGIGTFTERAGKLAQQVRVASEAISEGDASPRPKSAIEVVLEGLTSRRQSRAG